MAKLFCSRVSHNPFKEDMVTEIPEQVFEIDGYQIADRMLEGVLFEVKFDDTGVIDVKVNEKQKKYFEDNFNTRRFYDMVKATAQDVLDEGDEVDIPDWLKQKYFKNGINVAYIVPE